MAHPVTLTVEYPKRLSRGTLILKVLFGWLYVLIPHHFILFFYLCLTNIVEFIAFWAILFTGKYPRGMFDFVVGYARWILRVWAYVPFLVTDKYPPFSGRE